MGHLLPFFRITNWDLLYLAMPATSSSLFVCYNHRSFLYSNNIPHHEDLAHPLALPSDLLSRSTIRNLLVILEERKISLRLVSLSLPLPYKKPLTPPSGDSYTQTGFDPKSALQPNASNPLGNPPYPGWTSSNGPNWVDFLTYTYTQSLVQTYNLAYGGATVDSALVAPYTPTVLSLKNQVQDQFLPIYGSTKTAVPWKASTSLFAFFIGINDVGNSWWLANTTLTDTIFTTYDGLLEQVYKSGARSFLFLTVPPVNRAPLTLANGNWSIEHEGTAILDWNKRVASLASKMQARHSGVKTFVHDTWKVFDDVIANPKVYEQTAGLKNVTGWCTAYEK
jgi:phospholipase/lecithinase/hemolysin